MRPGGHRALTNGFDQRSPGLLILLFDKGAAHETDKILRLALSCQFEVLEIV